MNPMTSWGISENFHPELGLFSRDLQKPLKYCLSFYTNFQKFAAVSIVVHHPLLFDINR